MIKFKKMASMLGAVLTLLSAFCYSRAPTYTVEVFDTQEFEPAVAINDRDTVLLARNSRRGPITNIPNDNANDVLLFAPVAIDTNNQIIGYSALEKRLYLVSAPYFRDQALTINGIAAVYDSNDAGEVLVSRYKDGEVASIVSTDGVKSLGHLGGGASVGAAINNRGVSTGVSRTAEGFNRAFVFDQAMNAIPTLGGAENYGTAINRFNTVVGHSDTAEGTRRAFIYRDGQTHDLGRVFFPFTFNDSFALDINDNGTVVGYADGHCISPGVGCIDRREAIVMFAGDSSFTNLNRLLHADSDVRVEKAVAINNNGVILAEAVSKTDGRKRAVLLRPHFQTFRDSMYLRGTFNQWQSKAMSTLEDNIWFATARFSDELNPRFKFDALGDWSLNWGLNMGADRLTRNGSDIGISHPGEYRIRFNDQRLTYSLENLAVRIQAEDAILKGVSSSNEHEGFEGKGFADFTGPGRSSISYFIEVENTGRYAILIRYASAGDSERNISLEVVGDCCSRTKTFTLPNTYAWNRWQQITTHLDLDAGRNEIRLTSPDGVSANVDYFELRKL